MSDPKGQAGKASRPRAEGAPPGSVEEALERARGHARLALSEALATARALLEAASLAASGAPAEAHTGLAELSRALEALERRLAGEGRLVAGPLVEAILDALDAEIARWERRSQDDGDARAVLRAFLGLREILWEFGMRREGEPAPRSASGSERGAGRARPRRRSTARVQRVRVQG
jgi:hypothetical protein